MASSEKIWFCPDVFIDTSWVKFKHDTFFIVGATIIKSTSLLLHKLSELREEDECVSELHFTELNKGKAKMGIAFANEFWKCKEAYFRAIILKRDNEEFDKYSDKKQWRFLANSIHFLTTYKYLRANGNSVRIVLNRPRLFLDNLSEEFRHTHEFKMVLKESLKKQEEFDEVPLTKIYNPAITIACDSKGFDGIQLTDLLIGCIHQEMLPAQNQIKHAFMKKIKEMMKITDFANVSRWDTEERINVWDFHQKYKQFLASNLVN